MSAGPAAGAAGLHRPARPSPADGPLFVRRVGDRGPALLCLHGLFASGAFWMRLAGRLAQEFRLVAPDLVGFGGSPQPEAEYTADFHLDRLAPLVAEGPPWIVLGHSMGCTLAVELALQRPRDVAGLILFNAPVYASEARRREIFAGQSLLARWSVWSPRTAHVACEVLGRAPRPLVTRLGAWLRPEAPPESAWDYFRHSWRSFDGSLRHLVLEEDLLGLLARVHPPVLVVQGSQDRLADAPERLPWPPNVQLRVLEGLDHTSLLLREPDRAASIVRVFASRLHPGS